MTTEDESVLLEEYRRAQVQSNLRRHRQFGPLVFGIFLLWFLVGVVEMLAVGTFSGRRLAYPLVFVYMSLVGVLPWLFGLWSRRGQGRAARWPGDLFVGALLVGAAALGILDSRIHDVSAVVLICLPVALVHSSTPRRFALMFALVAAAIWLGTAALNWPLHAGFVNFLTVVAVTAIACVFVAITLERSRQAEFTVRRQLDQTNRELLARSRQLRNANSALELRGRELEQANNKLVQTNRELAKVNEQLESAAMTDPLTGVANRRRLYEILERELLRSRRYGGALSVAILDLDDFKKLNETYGHLEADQVLVGFAAGLRDHVRAPDLVARFGGEEFVIVMPDTGEAAAQQMLERFRDRCAAEAVAQTGIRVTFSAGVAVLRGDDVDASALLGRADEYLRRAKTAGKNRVLSA